ncbi:MAG: hypothetical protein H6818_02400 [Phycisphaerales bacterium]|nr:hypothetical protein [Phycisphaerales bacterium]MCB9863165.1 hypothetical protein [Phycisphaerales bacterium]
MAKKRRVHPGANYFMIVACGLGIAVGDYLATGSVYGCSCLAFALFAVVLLEMDRRTLVEIPTGLERRDGWARSLEGMGEEVAAGPVFFEPIVEPLRTTIWGPDVSKFLTQHGVHMNLAASAVAVLLAKEGMIQSVAWLLLYFFWARGYRLLYPIYYRVVPGRLEILRFSWPRKFGKMIAVYDLVGKRVAVDQRNGIVWVGDSDNLSMEMQPIGLGGLMEQDQISRAIVDACRWDQDPPIAAHDCLV